MKYLIILIQCFLGITLLNAQTLYSEDDYRKHFKQNISKLDPIEGIWSVSISQVYISGGSGQFKDETSSENQRKVAIIKTNNGFELKELNSFENSVVSFESTASTVYLYKNAEINSKCNAYLKNNGVLLEYERIQYGFTESVKKALRIEDGWSEGKIEAWSSVTKTLFSFSLLKIFPTISDINNNNISNQKSTGTGFAISSGGLIATNYHVIENAKQIKIKGVNGDFNKSYSAIVTASDKNNDLAIIKINDPLFVTNGSVPYIIKQTTIDVGESINLLGYPLTATMGEEIKFSNGIVSSKSGFQGDVTTYQISAPVQPGNSGGPLFDKSGNIIGIINAKHTGAENVAYAVKSSYLLNLIETLPASPKLQTVNSINNKTLSEQIKSIKKFVYILEIN